MHAVQLQHLQAGKQLDAFCWGSWQVLVQRQTPCRGRVPHQKKQLPCAVQVLRLECMRHPKRSRANEVAHEVEKSTAAVQSAARHEDEVHEVGLCAAHSRKGVLPGQRGVGGSL